MKIHKIMLVLLAVLALSWACSSEDEAIGFIDALNENTDSGTPGDATGPYQEVVVGVSLPTGAPVDLAGSRLDSEGTMAVVCGTSGISSPTWLWDGSEMAPLIAGANATKGYAQVTISLVPKNAD